GRRRAGRPMTDHHPGRPRTARSVPGARPARAGSDAGTWPAAGHRLRRAAPSLLLLVLAGCGSSVPPAAAPAPPFADCAALTAPPAAATGRPGAATERPDLPDITLPCFTGGRPVHLTDLRGPAVINLWGTWCLPCREELPAVQRLADRTAGRLHVIGVNTYDDQPAAASFAADKQVSLPTLYDRDKRLTGALGKVNLPVTVFVDGAGNRFVYNGPALDDRTLAALVTEHTGVAVST
ncbi:MAG TPA: TlpA disulfide reductase family protein, partial [Actinoplanes sp.]|nr:TlpA disulfide reductase family protein [Actinoplanes sp.]